MILAKNLVQNFCSNQLPTRKLENWKYLDFQQLKHIEFSDSLEAVSSDWNKQAYLLKDSLSFVTSNGCFEPVEPQIAEKGISFEILDHTVLNQEQKNLQQPFVITPFSELLSQGFQGLRINIHSSLSQPLHLLNYVKYTVPLWCQYAYWIRLAPGVKLTVLEESVGEGVYLNNIQSIVELGEGAALHYCKLQHESMEAFHLSNMTVYQAKGSTFSSVALQLGGQLSRDDLHCVLEAEKTETALWGFYWGVDSVQRDHHTGVYHQASYGKSMQHYKGMVSDQAQATFNGKIVVEKQTQQNVARQKNSNWLLSDQATINTKPELEIEAEDVQCSHGATIGQMQSEALFYLQSRGLSALEAKRLLAQGFIAELLEPIEHQAVRSHIECLLQRSCHF